MFCIDRTCVVPMKQTFLMLTALRTFLVHIAFAIDRHNIKSEVARRKKVVNKNQLVRLFSDPHNLPTILKPTACQIRIRKFGIGVKLALQSPKISHAWIGRLNLGCRQYKQLAPMRPWRKRGQG